MSVLSPHNVKNLKSTSLLTEPYLHISNVPYGNRTPSQLHVNNDNLHDKFRPKLRVPLNTDRNRLAHLAKDGQRPVI